MNPGDPLRHPLLLPFLSTTMSRHEQQPQPEKGILLRVQVALETKLWVMPPRPAKGIAEYERNLEWRVQEGEDGTSCDRKSNCIDLAVRPPSTGSVITQGQHLLPLTSVARLAWEATHHMNCS